jgi:hypothetical protein
MITKRDQEILSFVEDFHIATSKQIHRLFFPQASIQYRCERLRYLCRENLLKRTRSTIDNCFAYYIRKPAQIHHDLLRAELYVNIKEKYRLLEWHNEMPVGNVRPDALAYIEKGLPLLIEIHLSNRFDFGKYNIDLLPLLGTQPRIVICTDKNLRATDKRYRIVNTDMQGLDRLL